MVIDMLVPFQPILHVCPLREMVGSVVGPFGDGNAKQPEDGVWSYLAFGCTDEQNGVTKNS